MALKLNEHISNNTKLYTLNGETVTVLNLISDEGGQGDVYKVLSLPQVASLWALLV